MAMPDNETLRQRLKDYLIPAKNKGSYLCPVCGSGTGPNKTGAMHLNPDQIHCKCFSCGFYGDIFDLFGAQHKLDSSEAYKRVLAWAGETSASGIPAQTTAGRTQALQPKQDYSAYITTTAARLWETPTALAYLRGRGFTDQTLRDFRLGYDADKGQIVIPYGADGRYFIRRGVGEGKVFYKPPAAQAGPEPLFNAAALYRPETACVFVVESQLCALSVEQAGGAAVAIGGSGTTKLLAQLEAKPTPAVLALSLDNDERGAATRDSLAEKLVERGTPYILANLAGSCKDPNEALQQDAAAFAGRVGEVCRQATTVAEEQASAELAAYQSTSAAAHLDNFMHGVRASADTPAIPTGFAALDEALDGGLYEGLYVLGAISSLGKTTFALQMADQIAQAGQDVLFYSLEMSRSELMSKSISRHTWELANGDETLAKSARGITAGARYAGYTAKERAHIEKAVAAYGEYARRIYIHEGDGVIGAKQIGEGLRRHVQLTARTPVVVVDYLQILAPAEPRATDKQNTDRAVFELKRLSRQFKTPILAISSLNRENYTAKLSMSAFKESGAIEYSSDVLLGLQFQPKNGEDKLSNELIEAYKREKVREIELKVLKNRNGRAGDTFSFRYIAIRNFFSQVVNLNETLHTRR